MEFFEKYKKYIIVSSILVVFLLISIFIYYHSYKEDNKREKIVDASFIEKEMIEEKEETKIEEIPINEYYVDIKGAVTNPGVYKLESNSRVIDVVNLAGGVTEDADTRCINLSKKIKDEMVIYVYTKQEVLDMYKDIDKNDDVICNNIVNDAYVDYTNPSENTENDNNDITGDVNNKININTADLSLLTTLPNIGESKAQAIIDKRNEIGGFTSIEQLKEVNGIGDATFEKLKDLIILEWLNY